MIVVENLSKRFVSPKPVDAVRGVSFRCEAGQIYGLLGPNGAGKTTTLRMLATLLSPDAGTATLNGFDVAESPADVRASLGYLSTTTGLYGRLTARELLVYFATLQGVSQPKARTEEIIEQLEIGPFADARCESLSTGMKQKVSIARTLIHDPPILILDEPSTGLDVLVAESLLRFIEKAREAGKCVLFSTHIMSEAERLCDRIGIIHRGAMVADGTLEELREQTGEHYLQGIFTQLVESNS